ncbi:uncharacterized protein [Epargyreus clarus]|uniref:uncharacterized protein isoform X2 n=1 Tax=Epargyreus clarus TaxID=520877 RepID=UPI003C2ADD3E
MGILLSASKMDAEYDQKFEEMKKYIPFLESMIKRLESTNNGGSNPRKAQLDKIRSLRDLLQDKKKRMKMENLLKCETVLVNLYAKVEQRDASLDLKKDSTEQTQNEQSDLSAVRSKLKSVASKLQGEVPETLPEIARATNTEVVCTPGSKEPALFQRRPNKASLSPSRESASRSNDDSSAMNKRNYTRVLLSPEPKKKDWPGKSDTNSDKPLFSRRSPRRSPRRYPSPSYKKERKKSSKRRSKSSQQSKDLNITLKVPQESLNSLNTKDILTRIINCSDSDVDIDTLRGLRSQILGELNQTGAKDDISDLILKSYKNKDKRSKLKTPKKNVEVEEGEISDSESETIENIYGSLVVVNKDEGNVNTSNQSTDNQQARKIQICLVINSDKEKEKVKEQNPNDTFDITEFEAFSDEKSAVEDGPSENKLVKSTPENPKDKVDKDKLGEGSKNKSPFKTDKQDKQKSTDTIKSKVESDKSANEKVHDTATEKAISSVIEAFKPNFYQPLTEEKSKSEETKSKEIVKDNPCDSNENDSTSDNVTKLIEIAKNIRAAESNAQKQVKKDEVSEIDILQALKKEILGETVPVSMSDAVTPPMHQPKLTKVSSAQEIVSKKRISIENYKQKSTPAVKQPLFTPETYRKTSNKDDSKKQSLKLTEKECERFNLPATLSKGDSSDDDDKSPMSVDEIYSNLAPKSPDHEDFADTGIKPPVIIPSDPVKNVVVTSKVDVDMRTLMSVASPIPFLGRKSITSPLITSESIIEKLRSENANNNESVRKPTPESSQQVANDSSYLTNFDALPRSAVNYPNISPDKPANFASSIPPLMSLKIGTNVNPNLSPNISSSINPIMPPMLNPNLPLQLNVSMASNLSPILTPILTPNMNPSMTPNRNPVMVPVLNPMMTPNPMITPIRTPNARSYEMTPCPNFDNDDFTNQKHVYAPMFPTFEPREYSEKDSHNKSRWETHENPNWEDRNLRNTSGQQDLDYQRHRNDRFKRGMDSPQIRMDCPPTPNPSFGRMDTPMTPVHPFGRSDCPMTPSHPFGRSDCPMTPSHPFGRSDTVMTPTNTFGRDDYHNTASHKYNKSQDPRLNRTSNYDKYRNRNDDRNRSYFKDNRNMSNNNKYRRCQDNSYEQGGRNDRDRMSRRESSVGRSLSRDYDNDSSYRGDYYNNDHRYRNEKSRGFDDPRNQRNYRARSIGRANPSEDSYSPRGDNSTSRSNREGSIEKPISVQSHSGRSFNIDTSFNRTFQESKSPSRDMSFDARRQRASSVGRCLRDSPREDSEQRANNNTKFKPDLTERSRVTNFRRACSVGRDLKDYNSDKNFKDIKADLRSSKFDYFDSKSRDREDKSKTSAIINTKENELQSNRDSRSRSRDYGIRHTKTDDNTKYSPNKNFRDPRVRREMNNQTSSNDKYRDKAGKRDSPRHKNYGIVYSNDNIAKGTILASAAGVKNFKIPKIKRPVEEIEAENASKVSEVTKNEVATNNERQVDNLSNAQIKKIENKEERSESPADKRRNKEKSKEHVAPVADNSKSKPDSSSLSKKEEKTPSELTELVSSDSDSMSSCSQTSERRITRSVKRDQMKSKKSKESNVKRSKKIKKPIIYDSDSDSQADENIENIKKRLEENKKNNINETKEIQIKTVEADNKENSEKDLTKQVNESTKVLEPVKPNDEKEEIADEKNTATIQDEFPDEQKSGEQNNALDVSFGADDEMFSDNVGSGSVLDNIKALIADLDNDIEAPKINDFNDKFINNIISSNDSPIPIEVNENDFVSDMLINPKLDFDDVDYAGKSDRGSPNVEHTKDTKDNLELSKNENSISNLKKSESKLESLNDIKEKKENEIKGSAINEREMPEKSNLQATSTETSQETRDSLNNLNNEAIVSTTAVVGKADELPKDTQNTSSAHPTGDSFFIPDSTINSNEANDAVEKDDKDSQESIPDSTNELSSEMNSDISSTHNSADNVPTCSDANSSCADNLPRIDSIGKLLSILEDKNKIKELLTILGKDSGENEKIKKKLEKLSEIVSDDEETTNADSKDKNCEDHKNNKECVTDTSLQLSDQKGSEVDVEKENSSVESQVEDVGQKPDDVDKIVNNKKSDTVDKEQTTKVQKKESADSEKESRSTNIELVESRTVKDVDHDKVKIALTDNTNNDENVSQEISNQPSKEENDNDSKTEIKSGGKARKITRKGRFAKKKIQNVRVTRSYGGTSSPIIPPAPKKPSRELLKLHEDIREVFNEDVLNSTGIRMCRLAKMVDEKPPPTNEAEPVVVLEKIKRKSLPGENVGAVEKTNKKKNSKIKPTHSEGSIESESKDKSKSKPGPKCKTKKHDDDPYIFESDSLADSSYTVDSKEQNSDEDSDSGDSVKSSETSEFLVDSKKKGKRKRSGWKVGVIRKKNGKKKKADVKHTDAAISDKPTEESETKEEEKVVNKIPDLNCFTDKSYCFNKNVKNFSCRLCEFSGNDIVPHYKMQHPHSEIPLSRLNPVTAKEAIEQCEDMNLQAVSKIRTKNYVCRFCFKEFNNIRNGSALETFFWHVVSVHTGEYKQLCSECINVTRCPFNLDIPPPPKNLKGQLIGYICGRCNFTQVSLENLKTHVIVRHDDEQTEVYSINLAEISRKALKSLIAKAASEVIIEGPRVLRSSRSSQSMAEQSDDRSDVTEKSERVTIETLRNNLIQDINMLPKEVSKNKINSKFSFENEYMSDTSSYSKNDEIIKAGIKLERDDVENLDSPFDHSVKNLPEVHMENVESGKQIAATPYSDVLDYPHFKIKLSATGTKEYICCINGKENHYKTTLLISLKKHVQMKHSENWDGYCFVCKVIVTSQGVHKFKDCLQHFLDKHMDNFPVLDEVQEPVTEPDARDSPISKTYINVRPLAELISSGDTQSQDGTPTMPKIESVVSLGTPTDHVSSAPEKVKKVYKYEEPQAEIMSKKHRIVLETMLSPEKLIQIFKCAGRFCSYTTDNLEEALDHASAHEKIGGENSLKCAYCDFDPMGNAIDLVTHVFKSYSHCSYACSKCFYRASASQLVYTHIKRVHPQFDADTVPVLSSTAIAKDTSEDEVMTRDQAVLYYVCNNRDPENEDICAFRSFVLTKFREHLQTRHSKDQEFSCYICNISSTSTEDLVQHLKSHGLRIYQCCRCLFGADNEAELLAHASALHPLKQPKAYLRITTSKGNSSEVRVLPLAVLSKSAGQTTVVTPSADKDNPVKQAERSIDLEKLIGHTNLMIESMSTITNAATIEPTDVSANDLQIQLESQQTSDSNYSPNRPGASTSPAVLTLLKEQDTTNQLTVKLEPVETPEATPEDVLPETGADPDVVCLDSDEDSRQNVIDLSNEDISTADQSKEPESDTALKVPRSRLYKCSKCSYINKSESTFRRHLLSCYPTREIPIPCAYCSHTTDWFKITEHYNAAHWKTSSQYKCGLCTSIFISAASVKRHMKQMHTEAGRVANATVSPYAQNVVDGKRQVVKRKMSDELANVSSEPAAKLKKYGPQDVDRLPINPILDNLVHCSLCEFSTKVRLNMVRHLQLHAEQQPVPRTAPVNPVPHLETNEKHFDKMVNLASSSVAIRNDKGNKDGTSGTEHISPEDAAIYPKYVPDRLRFTCGAKDCAYISVNESMFKFHWETLHNGTNDYHCVHCPPHQHLDTTKPLTAARIIGHLKMHDTKLYACSLCSYYHHIRKVMDKHFREVHKGKLIIVREDGNTVPVPAPSVSLPVTPAPTMDLKPWQCGLCSFKSMLRPEVIEHCGKTHQSKMQFKCTYCGFRTSNIENITKHQSKQHPGKKEEVFYFYYREGSIPEEPDGTACWQKQSQRTEPGIKTEANISPPSTSPTLPKQVPTKPEVNLDIVKKEIIEPETNESTEETIEDLCNAFGQFCDPNGLKYKCSLCKIVIEDNKDAMQSHLYEELQYRRWGCGVCSYKAFHKPGLQQHVQTEHGYSREEPIALQVDMRIETWVAKLLEHQTTIIERNKDNLAKQKVEILRSNPGPSTPKIDPPEPPKSVEKPNVSMAELERLFGPLGVPSNMNYSCPKCNINARSEAVMQDHLESELNKIRWCCSVCSDTFQTYHEVQFHCRSAHAGQSARPREAPRDRGLRAAWVAAVLRVQKLSMNYMPVKHPEPQPPAPEPADTTDDSLLVVRYAENIPTPEEQMKNRNDSDDDRLVIDEPQAQNPGMLQCTHCPAVFKMERFFAGHVLKHYGLKPFMCSYCPYSHSRKQLECHMAAVHPGRPMKFRSTPIPDVSPAEYKNSHPENVELPGIICFVCRKWMTKIEWKAHFKEIGKEGDVVMKCCHCSSVHKNGDAFTLHHKQFHHNAPMEFLPYTLQNESTIHWCHDCSVKHAFLKDFKSHCMKMQGIKPPMCIDNTVIEIHDEDTGVKRKADDNTIVPIPKRVAKKSTTKLPDILSVAKKSTTKLPFEVPFECEEYSYYGTKPDMDNLENVTTLMPFCNTMVPFSLKKLSEIIEIYPLVVVKDINK